MGIWFFDNHGYRLDTQFDTQRRFGAISNTHPIWCKLCFGYLFRDQWLSFYLIYLLMLFCWKVVNKMENSWLGVTEFNSTLPKKTIIAHKSKLHHQESDGSLKYWRAILLKISKNHTTLDKTTYACPNFQIL